MTAVWDNALASHDAYLQVERRFIDAGAITELDILHGLSTSEVELLVRQERGTA